MPNKLRFQSFVCFIFLLFFSAAFYTREVRGEDKKEPNIKTAKGLNFNVPADWPLEERGGSLGPIPIEEYLVLKFEKIDEHFRQIESDIASEARSRDPRIKALEEQISDIDERLEDLERWLKKGEARRVS